MARKSVGVVCLLCGNARKAEDFFANRSEDHKGLGKGGALRSYCKACSALKRAILRQCKALGIPEASAEIKALVAEKIRAGEVIDVDKLIARYAK